MAFTLIELLVVISIVVLLISILMPALRNARRTSNAVKCKTNLRQLMTALTSYSLDYKGWLPYNNLNTGANYGEERSYIKWWSRLGQSKNKTTTAETQGYIPYDPKAYSGTVWHCPLASTDISKPWYFDDRFSAHYSMNEFVWGRRENDGSWPTANTGYRQSARLFDLTPDKIVLGDGKISYYSGGDKNYFVEAFTHSGGSRPWVIVDNELIGASRLHMGAANLTGPDGHVEAIPVDSWDETTLKTRFERDLD
tara:strand:+ start:352 stop:1110 length:759 start_codon:yes stop_codon:yes gene_type:complete